MSELLLAPPSSAAGARERRASATGVAPPTSSLSPAKTSPYVKNTEEQISLPTTPKALSSLSVDDDVSQTSAATSQVAPSTARHHETVEPADDRVQNQLRIARTEGEEIPLGFSIKDEDIITLNHTLRRKLFPVGFEHWAKHVQEVAGATEIPSTKTELITFIVYATTIIVFFVACIAPTIQYNNNEVLYSALRTAPYFPHRTRDILPADAHLVERWSLFNELRTLDQLEAWLVQVLPRYVIPVTFQFNNVVHTIRLTQRRTKLIDSTDPSPLLGMYNKRWATQELFPSTPYKPGVEQTSSYGELSYFKYQKKGGYKGHGGFVVWVNATDASEALTEFKTIITQGFLDRQTTALTVEWLVSNIYLPAISLVRVSTTVLPSGLLDNSVTVELVGVTMKGYRVASYLIFTLLPCFATAGLLYIPIKDTKRHGFRGWVREKGKTGVIILALSVFGTVMVIILTVVELLILPKTLNILDPRSTVGSWINNAVVVKNSHVSSEDAATFDTILEAFSTLFYLRVSRTVFLAVVAFALAFQSVRFLGYFLSYRATIIVWVVRYFIYPALTVFGFFICFTIGFGVVNHAILGTLMTEYSTYVKSFLNTIAANLGDWVRNGVVFRFQNPWNFLLINFFFLICHYSITFLMLALLVQGYETAAESMDIQLAPRKRKEKLHRYTWFHFREASYNLYRTTLSGLCTRRKTSGSSSPKQPSFGKLLTDNLGSVETENTLDVEQTTKPPDVVVSGGAYGEAYTEADVNPYYSQWQPGFQYVDDYGQVQWYYDPYQFNVEAEDRPAEKTQEASSLRWDWYDPYFPPTDWKPSRVEDDDSGGSKKNVYENKKGKVTDENQMHAGEENELHMLLDKTTADRLNEDYFHDDNYNQLMMSTRFRAAPSIKNMHTYVKRQKLNHTWVQSLGILLLVASTLTLVFTTFIHPYNNYMMRSAVEKAVHSATWADERLLWSGITVKSPAKDFFSIHTKDDVDSWFKVALPRILYPPDFPDQPSVVFNTSSFASEDFPILIAPWVSGISTTAAHLSLFQIKDRHTPVTGPYSATVPSVLAKLGFRVDPFTGAFAFNLPTQEVKLTDLLVNLLDTPEFLSELTVSLKVAMALLEVNLKTLCYAELTINFLTSGSITSSLNVREVHPMFLRQTPKILAEPSVIFFFFVLVITLCGEAHGWYTLYNAELTLRRRVAQLRKQANSTVGAEKFHHNVLAFKDIPESISMFEALLIYLFEKSILDSIAIVLMMYLFGVMAWGTSESNFNFALPVTHVLLDELHYRMTLGTQFTGFFKMSLAWLTCIAVLRLAPLFRGQKKFRVIWFSIFAFVWDLVFALAVIFALLMGFGFIFFITFGGSVHEFRYISTSLLSCFWIITGQFNLTALFTEFPKLSILLIFPLWVLLYITFLNIFTAIFVGSFTARLAEAEEIERLGLATPPKTSLSTFFGRLKRYTARCLAYCCGTYEKLNGSGAAPPTGEPLSLEPLSQTKRRKSSIEMSSDLPGPPRGGDRAPTSDSRNAEHHNPVTIISDTILERTQIVQLTDKDYDLLPSSTRIIAEEQVLQLIDRFRKLELGMQVYSHQVASMDGKLKFVADMEERLYNELITEYRKVRLQEGKLRHRLNVYENIAKDEQQELSRYLLFLENAVEEVECDIKEAEEEYELILKKKRGEYIF